MKNKTLLKEKIQIEKTNKEIKFSKDLFLKRLQEENQSSMNLHNYLVRGVSTFAILIVVVSSTKYFLPNSFFYKDSAETVRIHHEIEEHLNDAYVSSFDENDDLSSIDLE